jgi:DNA-binding MurR/RpiR family transcriptional regulator
MARKPTFLARVRDTLPDLHPAERRLGELVCDFPGEVASYSATELASLAGVSNATVTRFVRRLGYESYEEARREARLESETGSRLYLLPKAGGSSAEALTLQAEQSIANLQRTLADVHPDALDAVAQAMLGARKVWVIGFRASHAFASYLHWQLTQVMEDIVVLPGAGQTLGEHLVSVQAGDCVIFFGLRRRVGTTEKILAEVEGQGARLIFISDEGIPLRPTAEWHFRCETASPGALFDHVAVMALCHLLANRTIERAEAMGRARLRRIEALNDALDEL